MIFMAFFVTTKTAIHTLGVHSHCSVVFIAKPERVKTTTQHTHNQNVTVCIIVIMGMEYSNRTIGSIIYKKSHH